MKAPSPVRVLGFGGLVAAGVMAIGGFYDLPFLVGISGAVMVAANIYAMVKS